MPSPERSFPAVSAPIYLSTGHTAHSTEHTGIQRVTRSLARELQGSGLRVEFIEWVHSKRDYVVLEDKARRNLAREGGPAFESLDSLVGRVLPELQRNLRPSGRASPGDPSAGDPSLSDERISRFETIIRSIRHPIPPVPGFIDYLPVPRAGRRGLRRLIRHTVNEIVQWRDRHRIRQYIRELVALRRLHNRMTRQMVRLSEKQRDCEFRLAFLEQSAWRYKHGRDSLARAQADATAAGGWPQPPPPPGPPPVPERIRPEVPETDLHSLILRLETGRFRPVKGGWVVVPELMRPEEMRGVVRYCRRRRLKLAVVFHDAIAVTHPEMVSASIRQRHADYMRHLCRADRVLAVSRQSADDLAAFARERRLRPPRITVCPNGASFPSERIHLPPIPPRPFRALCVGTIDPRKNHRTLLAAYERIQREHPELDLRLTLIGNAYAGSADLVALVEEAVRRLPGLVWLRGIGDDELTQAYRQAHFTVFPSLLEGFGLPVLESLWHGRPCICADSGTTAENAVGGGCLTVDVTDPAALADAIIRMSVDHDLRQRLTEEAKSRLVRTWKDQAIDLVEALQPGGSGSQPGQGRTDYPLP